MEVECRILLSLKANKPHFTTIMAELNLYVCKNCGWSIEAPCDGIVFFAFIGKEDKTGEEIKNLVIYVVSYFDDFNQFYLWLKTQE